MRSCPNCGNEEKWHFRRGQSNDPQDRFDKAEPDMGYCEHCGFRYAEHINHSLEEQIKEQKERLGMTGIQACKKCGAPIRFVRSAKNPDKWIPVEAALFIATKDEAKRRLVLPDGRVKGKIIKGDRGYEPHWGYCPAAKEFRHA